MTRIEWVAAGPEGLGHAVVTKPRRGACGAPVPPQRLAYPVKVQCPRCLAIVAPDRLPL